ncbi:MAG: methyl-accepting chemotaxis protein [Sporomusaceae bacterium]|nr:methyl-accepting chemotaxis protein [Sporomusaceae bacterium]
MINYVIQLGRGASMKKKLVSGFILIATIPVILISIITTYFSQTALMNSVYDNNRMIAADLAKEMDNRVVEKVELLKALADSSDIQSMDTARQLPLLLSVSKSYKDISGVIVTDSQGMELVRNEGNLASIADREYFKQVKKGAEYSISEALISKGTGKAAVIVCVPIKDDKKQLKGTILGILNLNVISKSLGDTKIGETGYAFLVDSTGKILAHPDKKLVQDMADVSNLEPVQETMDGKTGVTSYGYEGEKKLAGYSKVNHGGWGVITQQSMSEAMAGANKIRWTGIIITIIAVLAAVLVGVVAAGILIKPVRELVAATTKISEGDLTVKAKVMTTDELGQLALTFNTMVDNLQELIKKIVGTAEQVAASSEELSATSNEAERSVSQIAKTLTDFAAGSHKQAEEMNETLQMVNHLTEVSQSMVHKAQSAANMSIEMAAAAETGDKAACNAVNKIEEIKEVTVATAMVIGALGEKSNQIGRILDVISGIAGQTNLLALNAAIEAARAGEQGRGFAVVAEEVRKLAEQSQDATKQIAQIVREIQSQSTKAIQVMNNGSARVNEGVEVITTAGEALQNILGKINDSVSMIREINTDSVQQRQGMQEMVRSAERVAAIARESNAGVQTTAAASEAVTVSMKEIADASESLAKMASGLQFMVSKFKI